MEKIEHSQGGSVNEKYHLTEEEWVSVRNVVTENRDGLLPAGSIYGIKWYQAPDGSSSPGKEGMQAFDEDYFYFCISDDYWGRAPLEEF